jgi:hypothetical protein
LFTGNGFASEPILLAYIFYSDVKNRRLHGVHTGTVMTNFSMKSVLRSWAILVLIGILYTKSVDLKLFHPFYRRHFLCRHCFKDSWDHISEEETVYYRRHSIAMGSLVSWCYQQQKFILSYIYYKLYAVGHLPNQNASCPGC